MESRKRIYITVGLNAGPSYDWIVSLRIQVKQSHTP